MKPNAELRKVFSIFAKDVSHHSMCDPPIGFVFQDLDAPEGGDPSAQLQQLMRDPMLIQALGPVFYGLAPRKRDKDGRYLTQYVVSPFVDGLKHMYNTDVDLYVWHEDTVSKCNTGDAWDNCMDIRKFATCQGCEKKPQECLQAHLQIAPRQTRLPVVTEPWVSLHRDPVSYITYVDAREELLVPWKTQIEGYTYIPHSYAGHADLTFGPHLATLEAIQLANYPAKLAARKDIARDLSAHKSFVRKVCSTCVLGSQGFKHASPCSVRRNIHQNCYHGAWTLDDLVKRSIEPVADAVTEHLCSTLAGDWRRVISGLAALGGRTITHQDRISTKRKSEYVIRGLRFSGLGEARRPVIEMQRSYLRAKRDSFSGPLIFLTLDEFFAEVGPTEKALYMAAPILSDELLAVAAQLATVTRGSGYRAGFNGYVTPHIEYVSSGWRGISLGLCLATKRFERNFSSFKEFATYAGHLPMFDKFASPQDLQISLDGRMSYR